MPLNPLFERLNRESWDFVWGSPDVNHLVKAVSTIVSVETVESWIHHPQIAWNGLSAVQMLENGRAEEVYTTIYNIGTGSVHF